MVKRLVFPLVALIVLVALPVLAGSGTFSNPSPIAIPASGTSGVASPFPSSITVSGLAGVISDVNVTIHDFAHSWPSDVQILLVGSDNGANVVLLSKSGLMSVSGTATVTFDDQAPAIITNPVASGTFQPTNDNLPVDLTGEGAPSIASDMVLSAFNGENPNGNWQLYVYDQFNPDTGSIAGGWSIEVTTVGGGTPNETGAPIATFCYPRLTASAVVGSLPADTQIYYAPGNVSPGLVLKAGTYYVLGVDESGQYYAVVLGCDRLWVPVASMVPNTNPNDAAWYGHPLPTTVIGA